MQTVPYGVRSGRRRRSNYARRLVRAAGQPHESDSLTRTPSRRSGPCRSICGLRLLSPVSVGRAPRGHCTASGSSSRTKIGKHRYIADSEGAVGNFKLKPDSEAHRAGLHRNFKLKRKIKRRVVYHWHHD
jgi:hypothetical protein